MNKTLSDFSGLEEAFSPERFGTYLAWATGDPDRALALYTLNTQVSESLYTPMQALEIALRNRIHRVLSAAYGEEWFSEPGVLIGDWEKHQVTKAIDDIIKERKTPTPGRIVAALTLGFWTAMFGSAYENLWQTTLHQIAIKTNGKGLRRKDFSTPLTPVRKLRNRIAHHEPILHWDLPVHSAKMVEMTRWLSPAAADWCEATNRFNDVYPREGLTLIA